MCCAAVSLAGRRALAPQRFCRPSYDMRISFALAGGPVARTAGFAAVWQCGCTAVHTARGRRLTWLTAVHGEDGRVSAGVRRLGTARFSLSLCARRPCQRKRGFLCERSLERCTCGQGGVSSGFRAGAALRSPTFEERRNVLCGWSGAPGLRQGCQTAAGVLSAARKQIGGKARA